MDSKKYIVMLVENNAGVLARVSSLFCQRGFNIDSLNVAATDNPDISRITISTHGEEATLTQIINQTKKLIEAKKVYSVEEKTAVLRELLLLKLECKSYDQLDKILVIAADRNAKVIDVSDSSAIVEFTGSVERVDKLIERYKRYELNILEICRTGVTAIDKDEKSGFRVEESD